MFVVPRLIQSFESPGENKDDHIVVHGLQTDVMPKAKPANKQINVPKDAEVLHLQHVICAEGSSE